MLTEQRTFVTVGVVEFFPESLVGHQYYVIRGQLQRRHIGYLDTTVVLGEEREESQREVHVCSEGRIGGE